MEKSTLMLWWIKWDQHSPRTGRALGVLVKAASVEDSAGKVPPPEDVYAAVLLTGRQTGEWMFQYIINHLEKIMFYLCTLLNVFEFLLQIFFKDASKLEAIRGEHAPQKNVSGATWLAQGVKSIHVLKSRQKLAFKGTESEWNLKVLSHDCEAPGFKRKMWYKRSTGPPEWCGEMQFEKTEGLGTNLN